MNYCKKVFNHKGHKEILKGNFKILKFGERLLFVLFVIMWLHEKQMILCVQNITFIQWFYPSARDRRRVTWHSDSLGMGKAREMGQDQAAD